MRAAVETDLARAGRKGADGGDVLIVGCGRRQRRDDQLGLRVAALLADDPPRGAVVLQSEAPGIDLLTGLSDQRLLVIVDAAHGAGEAGPGSWRRSTWQRESGARGGSWIGEWPGAARDSSHLLGVADALRVGAALGTLPPEVWVYAIAGADFGYGDELTAASRGAVLAVAHAIVADLGAWRRAQEASDA